MRRFHCNREKQFGPHPARTPTDIYAKLNATVNQIVAKPNVDKRLRYEPYVGAFAEARGFLKRQIDTWGGLIRATGISADWVSYWRSSQRMHRIHRERP